MQIHTPTADAPLPPVRVFDMLKYFERFYPRGKPVKLLGACDVSNNGRHLGFYQELEIMLKPLEMVIFLSLR